MKDIYLEIMEKAVGAYTVPLIEDYIAQVRREGLTEHGFPRLTADVGILVAHGRMTHLRGLFVELMDLCCREIPVAFKRSGGRVGNEFSVKEIVMCLLTLEEYDAFPEEIGRWKEAIRAMDPYAIYGQIAPVPPIPMANWAAFAAASEQLRIYAGLGAPTSAAFVDNQVASQLFNFDENGMYRDPNEPFVYDLTTRLQLSLAMHYGYNGSNSKALGDYLALGSVQTPLMQSVTGEIPFGGRSNQFLHNEPTFAALFEYEARQHKKKGDLKKAGQCKDAAMLCARNTLGWLNTEHVYHIKNGYDPFSGFGCEAYGYFHKYMVTVASFAHFAYLLADDTIEPQPCAAASENHIHSTSEHFHKTFVKFGDYFLEYETRADFHYDCNGLGRVHRRGAPSPICLSVPVTPTPSYGLDITNPGPLSVCAGMEADGKTQFSCEEGTVFELMEQSVSEKAARVHWRVTLPNGCAFTEDCTVDGTGVALRYASEGDISVRLPLFETDGWRKSRVECDGASCRVLYEGWQCRYDADAPILPQPEAYANRNGHYRSALIRGDKSVQIHISIEKAR
ncbi:MAG: hypothetical protein J5602_01495 [Clostridia bacterium]|nr:hypothetical protein [Clostridia bacterium]